MGEKIIFYVIYPGFNMSRYECDNTYLFFFKDVKTIIKICFLEKMGNMSDRQVLSIKMKQNIFGKASVCDIS